MACVVWQLFDCPFVLVDVVAEAHLGIDIVTEQVNICLVLLALVQGWELKKRFLDGSIVVNMDGVLEHVVDKVRVGLDEVVQG